MPDNFKQVVNLQAENKKKKAKTKVGKRLNTTQKKQQESFVEEIDHVYNTKELKTQNDLSQIKKPKMKDKSNNFFKNLSIVLSVIIVIILSFYFFSHRGLSKYDNKNYANIKNKEGKWYAVQLVDKETYYGFIRDITTDPIVLEKVYYNYNQILGEAKNETNEKKDANIRLVKRGKEAHGPDGTMDIVRAQVLYMEALGKKSKILKAILNYEK